MRSKSLILARILCLVLVSVGTFVGGVSPYLLKWNKAFPLRGRHFAVGLFLVTGLMRCPVDAMETFGHLTEKGYHTSFMLPIAGWLLTMLADSAISHVHGKKEEEQSSRTNSDLEVSGGIVQRKGSSANGEPHHHNASIAIGSPSNSILLITALCLPSDIGGITIGVIETKADARKAMWIISLQGIFAAIAMGIALLRMMPNRPLLSGVAYLFAFAIAISSPIGMAIGIIVNPSTQGAVAGWIFAIFMGLSRGVFWYVFSKLSLSERYMPQSVVPIHKFLAKMLWVGVRAVMIIWDAFGWLRH
ncbi:zinc transporter 11-like [Syzygium oleosum]|uniref:zinc transporter 11-like n=1 Tax=Syzygium oleosum TaxID=219896 RepID=UPI0024B9B3D9|nr:zinc transporter 11-like [Syzygium oleosum]